MDNLTDQVGSLSLNNPSSPSRIVLLVSKTRTKACYLHCSRDKFYVARFVSAPEIFEPGQLYRLANSSSGTVFSELRDDDKIYAKRSDFEIRQRGYDMFVLRALLLGCRFRDYEQSSATITSLTPLIITLPNQTGYLTSLTFVTEAGRAFSVSVDKVDREGDRIMKLFCSSTTRLPSSAIKGVRILLADEDARTPIVTEALESVLNCVRAVDNRRLLDLIYGESGVVVHAPVDRTIINIWKKVDDEDDDDADDDYEDVRLNAEQSEAVHRYLNNNIPAFAVESPPGSGKTMTAAAMAVSYDGDGLQLFLSTANVPVYNMAFAMDAIDIGNLKIRHLVSRKLEAMQSPEERSPFSVYGDEDLERLRNQLKWTRDREEKKRICERLDRARDNLLAAHGNLDVLLSTVDLALITLLKKPNLKHPCPIQRQLEIRVRRVVVDEASQLTEAALNALIICFPLAQIVLIGDSKQLPPFKFVPGEVVSELAARSALDVLKRRRNVPVITLRRVYRAAPSRMQHYSDIFYGGQLVSGKPESSRVQLTSIARGVTNRCVFIEVRNSKAQQSGTSKINDQELAALEFVIAKLRTDGYDHEDVMVIAYYEAQRKLAKTRLPEGYEVLTVDAAQGREKEIVIVMTTRDKSCEGGFINDPLRANVALSRHKEALVILGAAALRTSEPWDKLFKDGKYFQELSFGSK